MVKLNTASNLGSLYLTFSSLSSGRFIGPPSQYQYNDLCSVFIATVIDCRHMLLWIMYYYRWRAKITEMSVIFAAMEIIFKLLKVVVVLFDVIRPGVVVINFIHLCDKSFVNSLCDFISNCMCTSFLQSLWCGEELAKDFNCFSIHREFLVSEHLRLQNSLPSCFAAHGFCDWLVMQVSVFLILSCFPSCLWWQQLLKYFVKIINRPG